MDEFAEFVAQQLKNSYGEEGYEDEQLTHRFLMEKFGEYYLSIAISSMLIDAQYPDSDPMDIIFSAFLCGLHEYRNFMIERGVDVLALEGRA